MTSHRNVPREREKFNRRMSGRTRCRSWHARQRPFCLFFFFIATAVDLRRSCVFASRGRSGLSCLVVSVSTEVVVTATVSRFRSGCFDSNGTRSLIEDYISPAQIPRLAHIVRQPARTIGPPHCNYSHRDDSSPPLPFPAAPIPTTPATTRDP